MNIIDVIVLAVLLVAIRRGLHLGLLRLFLSACGFILGLYLGSLLAGVFSDSISSAAVRLCAAVMTSFIVGLALSTLGESVGILLSRRVHRIRLGNVDRALGAAFEIIFVLGAVWILSSVLSNVTANNLGREIRGSLIVSTLNSKLPPAPDFLSELERVIGANGMPKVFVGNEPSHQTVIKNVDVNSPAVAAAQQSVVKIEARGCGGLIDGSGFVAANKVVATNAHVIAGLPKPYIVTKDGRLPAVPIYFDPNLDFALLYVPKLNLAPLPITADELPAGSGAIIMGYPGGGPLTIIGGGILNQTRAVGRNIYDRGIVSREIYEVQGEIEPGNSGGPLLDTEGRVVGVIFAKSVTNTNVGYALLSNQIVNPLERYGTSHAAVSTGRCAAE
jgi:S1-C subfamily serine protease